MRQSRGKRKKNVHPELSPLNEAFCAARLLRTPWILHTATPNTDLTRTPNILNTHGTQESLAETFLTRGKDVLWGTEA